MLSTVSCWLKEKERKEKEKTAPFGINLILMLVWLTAGREICDTKLKH